MHYFRLLGIAALFSINLVTTARADISPDVVARCKRATGFVFVGKDDRGTAFHIGRGFFVTNAHVVEDADGETKVQLILDSGESTQRAIRASILRINAGLDLALLRIEDQKLPPALDMSDASLLTETMSVTAFGYPFGTDLAVGKSEYPNITVSMGRISSVRKESGKIKQIQIDASLNPGNSGGPLVNNAGQVVGVVRAAILGSGLSFAVPVDDVQQFLYGPPLALHAPAIQKAVPGTAGIFTIDVPPDISRNPNLSATLTLSSSIVDKRTYKSADTGGERFTVSAPLFAVLEGDLLEAIVEERDSTFSLWIKDRIVQIGNRPIHLSEIREITQGAAPSVVINSGQRFAVSVTGLNSVETWKQDMRSTIDLSGARRITLAPASTKTSAVRYEVTLRSGSVVLRNQKGTIDGDGVHPDVLDTPQVADKQTNQSTQERVHIVIDGRAFTTSTHWETLRAVFDKPDGGVTAGLFKGYVLVKVRGYGTAYTDEAANDAFYLFTGPFQTPQNGHDGGFYQLTFGTQPLKERDLGSNAKNFLVGALPPYNANHIYTFVLDTRLTSPGRLHFGVSDGGYDGNEGAFVITVSQLVPER